MKNTLLWPLPLITAVFLVIHPSFVLCSEVSNKFINFSLEDPQEIHYSQLDMQDKITVVILQSRTTLQTAIECKTQLKKLIQDNQKVQMISIMDLKHRPGLAPKFALKAKIPSQDPTSKEFPFLLDWEGDVTKALGGEDSKCMVLVVDPTLNIAYKKEYKKAAINNEIKPLLDKLCSGQE